MTQPIEYHTPAVPLDFPNRKTGLMVAGILLIVMGSVAGCFAILTPVGVVAANALGQQSVPIGGAIAGAAFYALTSTGLIWCGIGSVRARRWIRPIVLILSTIALSIGVVTLVGMIVMAPNMAQAIQASRPANAPPVPAAAATVGLILGIAGVILVYLVIPGVYFWFYRQKDVRKTLEFYDPQPRWTDRCPITVLGLSVMFGLGALVMPMPAAYGVLPLFGFIARGIAAVLAVLVIMAVQLVAAVLVYRQRLIGWWLAVGLIVAFLISSALNVAMVDFNEMYSAMGLPPEQVAVIRQNPMGNPVTMMIGVGVMSLVAIGYTMAIRKHFTSTPATASTQ